MQETFVKLNRALERGDTISNVRSWLRTVAQNGTVDELRRSRSVPLAELPERTVQDAVESVATVVDDLAGTLTEPVPAVVERISELTPRFG